jgi:hypothetical protein
MLVWERSNKNLEWWIIIVVKVSRNREKVNKNKKKFWVIKINLGTD